MNKLFDVLLKVLTGLFRGFVESRFRQECQAIDGQIDQRDFSPLGLSRQGPPIIGIL
jgi:hypothetical protein